MISTSSAVLAVNVATIWGTSNQIVAPPTISITDASEAGTTASAMGTRRPASPIIQRGNTSPQRWINPSVRTAPMIETTMFSWLIIAPLGGPVVPLGPLSVAAATTPFVLALLAALYLRDLLLESVFRVAAPLYSKLSKEDVLQVASRELSPEQVFEQQWALALLNEVLAQMQREFAEAGKETLFEEIKVFLTGEKRDVSCAQLANKLGTTEAALKMTVSRMRRRYRELLRAEVARTVASAEEIDAELRALSAALSL